MPLTTMHMYPGRTPEPKAGLVRGLTEVVAREIGVPQPSVDVVLIGVPREHWACGGRLSNASQAPATTATT
jgi:4-oxalocrotonate tautomerase